MFKLIIIKIKKILQIKEKCNFLFKFNRIKK